MVWVAIAVNIGVALISAAVSYAMATTPEAPRREPPQFDPAKSIPTVTESEPVPIVFGTYPISNPNVVHIGDFGVSYERHKLETDPVLTTLDSIITKTDAAWRFRANLIFGICAGHADLIARIDVDGIPVAGDLSRAVSDAADLTPDGFTGRGEDKITIHKPELFVGEGVVPIQITSGSSGSVDSRGYPGDGISGQVGFDDGGPDNILPEAINAQWSKSEGGNLRGLTTAILFGGGDTGLEEIGNPGSPFYHGTRSVFRPWRFLVQRIDRRGYDDTQWYPSKAKITVNAGWNDMNPAHIVHEILTDRVWGIGVDTASIDSTSFEAAADLFADEGLGMSMVWNSESEHGELIREVERTTDSVVFYDEAEAAWKFSPIREDWTLSALSVFDESNVVSVEDYVTPSNDDLPTSMHILYFDMEEMRELTYSIHDQAAVLMRGGRVVFETLKYPGVVARETVRKIAHRDLRGITRARATIDIVVHASDAEDLRRGDPFRFQWSEWASDVDKVFRVVNISLGSGTDPTTRIEAIEDVFREREEWQGEPEDGGDDSGFDDPIEASPIFDEIPMWLWAYLDGDESIFTRVAAEGGTTFESRIMAMTSRPEESGSVRWDHRAYRLLEQDPDTNGLIRQSLATGFCGSLEITAINNQRDLETTETLIEFEHSGSVGLGDVVRVVAEPTLADLSIDLDDAGPPTREYDYTHLDEEIEQFWLIVEVIDGDTALALPGLFDTVPQLTVNTQTALIIGNIPVTEVDDATWLSSAWFDAGVDESAFNFAAGRVRRVESLLTSSVDIITNDCRVSTQTRERLAWDDITPEIVALAKDSETNSNARPITRSMRPLVGSTKLEEKASSVEIQTSKATRRTRELTCSALPPSMRIETEIDDWEFDVTQTLECWVFQATASPPTLLRILAPDSSGLFEYTANQEEIDGGPYDELYFVVVANALDEYDTDTNVVPSWQPAVLHLER